MTISSCQRTSRARASPQSKGAARNHHGRDGRSSQRYALLHHDDIGILTQGDKKLASPAIVRRTEGFIRARAAHPIGLDDIARAAGAGRRALQSWFRRFRDTTPMAFLKAVRLDAARKDLVEGRCASVTDAAFNVQVAVDTEHHLIVAHEVTNSGSDRAQLANMAKEAKAVLKTETLEAVADRDYFSSSEILACHEAGITVTLPKPLTSGAKSGGRFGKQDFVYLPAEDAYRCPS